jgi:hypothetical protein
VRALARSLLGFSLGLFVAAAGCVSGISCTDKGGTCNPGTVCPSGTELPTAAQLQAAGTESGAYGCPANTTAVDAGTDVATCCLPIPTTN